VSQQDRAFMAVFKAVIIFLMGLTVVIFILARLIGQWQESTQRSDVLYQKAVQERIQPVGQVNLGEAATVMSGGAAGAPAPGESTAAPSAAAVEKTPKEIVSTVCSACHGTGVLGAPKLGDKAAWEPRLAQGFDTLVQHATHGFKAMPAKGGNASLTDAQVRGAVAQMLEQAGLPVPAQAAAASGTASPPAPAPSTQPAASAQPSPAAASGKPDLALGKQVYGQTCFACHGMGVAGAPKLGDAAAWKPRIGKGMETLVNHAIHGFQGSQGIMPPKGGNPSFSDQQIASAVAYMVSEVK
jgi:cytochrome c5